LLVESIYRYKGQSAPAVVSEVNFAELSPLERRKIFVGMTRGQMAVEIVLSTQAERCFAS
jgi:superfamily I DNA and RNA helicase